MYSGLRKNTEARLCVLALVASGRQEAGFTQLIVCHLIHFQQAVVGYARILESVV